MREAQPGAMITRRYLLRSGVLALAGTGMTPPFLARIAAAESKKKGRILVALFQRGAADGLNIVVPYGEQRYYELRPSIAIPAPGRDAASAALDLDGFFGLHPSLAPLLEIYRRKDLAIIHAVGSPNNTRSHFDAQDYMESATPGVKSSREGWLNRYLRERPRQDATPFRAVSLTATMPRSLQGSAAAVSLAGIREFQVKAGPYSDRVQAGFQAMYAASEDDTLRRTGRETFEAIEFLRRADPTRYQPENGAVYPQGPLGSSMSQIAQLIRAGVGLEVAFVESGGWDHHVNEGGTQGQLAQKLKELGFALAAFSRDMADRMDDILVLTMSEFGRTARENGNRGTDHGHANVMFALGPVRGGRVFGVWPGLGPEQLFEGRDLALTTDFRDIFAETLTTHLGLKNASRVLPGHTIRKANLRGFLRS